MKGLSDPFCAPFVSSPVFFIILPVFPSFRLIRRQDERAGDGAGGYKVRYATKV